MSISNFDFENNYEDDYQEQPTLLESSIVVEDYMEGIISKMENQKRDSITIFLVPKKNGKEAITKKISLSQIKEAKSIISLMGLKIEI